jgi:hypothetical protein
MPGLLDFFLNVSKAAPVLATQLKQKNDEDKARLAGSAAVAANGAKARADGYRKQAAALAQKDPAKADALNAQADKIENLLPGAISDPSKFLADYAALPPMTLTGTGTSLETMLTSQTTPLAAPTVLTDTAAFGAVADVAKADQTESGYRSLAGKLLSDPNVTPEDRIAAQAYLDGKSTDTTWAARYSNKAFTLEGFNAAMTGKDYRTASNIYDSLSPADQAKVSPATLADLRASQKAAQSLEGYGLTSASLSIQGQLLNLQTGEWNLELSKQTWANTLTLQGQDKANKQRSLVNEWVAGGNWQTLESIKDDLKALGYVNPDALIAAAKENEALRKRQTVATVTTSENQATSSGLALTNQTLQNDGLVLSNQAAKIALDKIPLTNKTERLNQLNAWVKDGQVDAISAFTDQELTDLGVSRNSLLASAQSNQAAIISERDNRLSLQLMTINEKVIDLNTARANLKNATDPRKMIQGWIDTGQVELLTSLTPEELAGYPGLDKAAILEQARKNRATADRDSSNRLAAQDLSIKGQQLSNDGQQISNEGSRAAIDQLKTRNLGDQRTQVLQWADGGQVEVLKAMTDQELSALGFTTPESRNALRTRAQNNRTLLDQGRQNVLDGQKLANQAGELNLETGKFDLEKSKKNFVDAQAVGDVEAKAKLQAWIDSGNIEALNSLTPEQWTKYGLDKTSSLTRATANRDLGDRSRTATVATQEAQLKSLNNELDQALKDGAFKDATRGGTYLTDLAQQGGGAGLNTLLTIQNGIKAGDPRYTKIWGTDPTVVDSAIQEARNKQSQSSSTTTIAKTTAEQTTAAAESANKIRGLTDATAKAQEIGKLADNGKIGLDQLDILLKEDKITQQEYDAGKAKANAVQGSNDLAREAQDFQNQNLVGQAKQQYSSIMLKQEVSNAQDVATISSLGDAGIAALNRLHDAGKLSDTEYQIAVNNARDSQNDLNTARDQKAQSLAEGKIAGWVDKDLVFENIPSAEWGEVKAALGLTDPGLKAYLAKKRATGETTAKYEANQRAKVDASSQLDLWVKAGVKPSAAEMKRVGDILGIGAAGVNQAIQRGVNDRDAQQRQQGLAETSQKLANAKTAGEIANAKRELDAQIRRVDADIANLNADNKRQGELVTAQIANLKAKVPGSKENKLAVDSINKYAKGKRDTAAKLRTQANVLRNSKDTFGNVDPKYLALANAKDAEAAKLETEAGMLSQQAISLATTGDPNSVAQPATPAQSGGVPISPNTPIVIGQQKTYPPLESDGGGSRYTYSDSQATKAQTDAAQLNKLNPNDPNAKTTVDNIIKSWLSITGWTDTPGNRNAILQWLKKFAK